MNAMPPTLIIFSALPGCGKTTLAKRLAQEYGFLHVRLDTIEQSMLRTASDFIDENGTGYDIAYHIALDNLQLDQSVIADTVNSMLITQNAWRDIAETANARYFEVELICSDKSEHKRRVEMRKADIQGHDVPTWQDVQKRDFARIEAPDLIIDTSKFCIKESIAIEALARLNVFIYFTIC